MWCSYLTGNTWGTARLTVTTFVSHMKIVVKHSIINQAKIILLLQYHLILFSRCHLPHSFFARIFELWYFSIFPSTGSWYIDPHFLHVGTSWRWVVSFTPRPPYTKGSCPRCPLGTSFAGPQSRCQQCVDMRVLMYPASKCGPSALQPYTDWTMPAPLFQILPTLNTCLTCQKFANVILTSAYAKDNTPMSEMTNGDCERGVRKKRNCFCLCAFKLRFCEWLEGMSLIYWYDVTKGSVISITSHSYVIATSFVHSMFHTLRCLWLDDLFNWTLPSSADFLVTLPCNLLRVINVLLSLSTLNSIPLPIDRNNNGHRILKMEAIFFPKHRL
jgi:hypothetical protein